MTHHPHGHDPGHTHIHSRNKQILRLSLLLIGTFMLIEALAGWLTGSLALLSDAGHMLSDAAALALSLIAFHLGERPADRKRSYGYQRLEIIAAAINGATLIIIAALIITEALQRLTDPPAIASTAMLLIAVLGLIVNLAVAWLMLRGDPQHNLNMQSAYLHVLGDLLGSIGAIAAALLIIAFGWQWADPLASLIIAILIGKSGWHTCRDSLNILMEGTPAHISLDNISAAIRTIEGVQDIHDIHAWTITSDSHALSCHIVVDPQLNVRQAFVIARRVEKTVQAHGIAHVTVQTEPPEHGHPQATCATPAHNPDHQHQH